MEDGTVSREYLEAIRQSAARAETDPAWKTAGILLNERNFETSQVTPPSRTAGGSARGRTPKRP